MTKIKPINACFLKSDGWKLGDKVRCIWVDKKVEDMYEIGRVYTLKKNPEEYRYALSDGLSGFSALFELVEREMEYEDKWRLNDGSETIPDNAQKLEHEGSVVAYRLPIEKIEVGDYVTISEDTLKRKVLAFATTNRGECVVCQFESDDPRNYPLRWAKLARKGS